MLSAPTVPFTGFEVPVEIIVLGIVTGLVYALLGVGLTLVYKSTRVLNFAHGETGALAAGVVPILVVKQGWSYLPALAVALLLGATAGAVTEVTVIRRLRSAPRLIVLVATIGVAQVCFALASLLPKEDLGSAVFPTPFDATVTVGGLRLGSGPLLILVSVPLVVGALVLFFRLTRVGLAARAAAENTAAAQLSGVHVDRVSLVIWVMAGGLAAVSAVLIGPTRPIVTQVALGPSLMVRALAAAMIGGLVSLPRVFAGGLAIGVLEALVIWNYPSGGVLEVTLFVVIVASLLLRRGLGAAARGGEASAWSLSSSVSALDPMIRRLPAVRRLQAVWIVGLVLAAVVLPLPLSNAHRVLLSGIVLFALIGLSMVVLTGLAGQVSLGQFAFVGLGAMVGGRLNQLGYPPWMAMLYAALAGAVVALLIGLPALRIRGLFLAVTTLSFAVASTTWLPAQTWLVQAVDGRTSLEIPRPVLFGVSFAGELRYYWLCLGVLVAAATVVHLLRRSGVGRCFVAVRDNERAAATLGVPPRRTKLTAFVLAGLIASLGGYFYGGLLVGFSDPLTFAPELSLLLIAMVVFGGITTVTGAIVGALWVRGLGFFVAPLLPNLLGSQAAQVVSGIGLVSAVLQFPGGVVAALMALRDRVLSRWVDLSPAPAAEPAPRAQLTPRERTPAGEVPALAAVDVTVRFGGHTVVDAVSIHAARGEIVGLVGPNGAGKTTLFDVLSGQVPPASGQVLMGGQDITMLRPEQRAVLGLGRTYQQAALFEQLTTLEVLQVALECRDPSEVVPCALSLPPARAAERRKSLRAAEVVDLLGLGQYAGRRVAELSTGTRRLVELGTMVALGADVLLLDEPAAGVAQREVEALGGVLSEIRDHLDATVLIVEHDIPLITSLVDRLYVLAAGVVIAEGPPAVLREDAAVVAAYLGSDERVIRRSGSRAGPPELMPAGALDGS